MIGKIILMAAMGAFLLGAKARAADAPVAFDQGVDIREIIRPVKAVKVVGKAPFARGIADMTFPAKETTCDVLSMTLNGGHTRTCGYYKKEAEATSCVYPKAAYLACRVGNPSCGAPNSPKNRCTRSCLLDSYKADKNTPGCFVDKNGDSCPAKECLYYDHAVCFQRCGCEYPPVPLD